MTEKWFDVFRYQKSFDFGITPVVDVSQYRDKDGKSRRRKRPDKGKGEDQGEKHHRQTDFHLPLSPEDAVKIVPD